MLGNYYGLGRGYWNFRKKAVSVGTSLIYGLSKIVILHTRKLGEYCGLIRPGRIFAVASHFVKTDYIAPGKKLPAYEIDTAKCIKCGACIAGCKFGAISKK